MSDTMRDARTDPTPMLPRTPPRAGRGPVVGGNDALANLAERLEMTTVDELPHNAVRLSDGRVVTMRETTAYDDEQVIKSLTAAGYNMANLAAPTLTRFTVFQAIMDIDGQSFRFPKGATALDAMLMQFRGKDVVALTKLYAKVAGLDEDELSDG